MKYKRLNPSDLYRLDILHLQPLRLHIHMARESAILFRLCSGSCNPHLSLAYNPLYDPLFLDWYCCCRLNLTCLTDQEKLKLRCSRGGGGHIFFLMQKVTNFLFLLFSCDIFTTFSVNFRSLHYRYEKGAKH